MVDISKDLKETAELLLHHKRIIIPTALSLILPIILLFLFLQLSGMLPLLKEVSILQGDLIDQDSENMIYLNSLRQEGYSEELINYLEKKEAKTRDPDAYSPETVDGDIFTPFLTLKNIILFFSLLIIWLIGSFLFSCMSYSIIALAINGKPLALRPVLRMTAWFFFHLLSLRFLIWAIIIVPSIVGGIIVGILFVIHPIAGVIGILALVAGMIAYIFYISIRLFFSLPSMYMEKHGPISSIKHSIILTKGYVAQVVLIFLIIYSLTIIVNGNIQRPLGESVTGVIIGTNIPAIGFYFLLLSFFVIVESIIFAFEHVFQFYTYLDMKEIRKADIK